MNVVRVLASKASDTPQKNAIIFESRAYTFQKVFKKVSLSAAVLRRLGVKQGDRVAIQLPKSMDFIFLFLSNLSIGGVTLPLNTAYKGKEVEYFLKEKLDIEMWAEARVNSADEELFKKMKKAGFKAIAFGIDGGNQKVLDFYNKKTKMSQIRKAVNMSRKMGFYTYGTFIMGAPIEKEKDLEDSINLAKSLPLDRVAFFVLEYGAGSPLWEEAIKDGKITRDEYLVFADSARGLGNFPKEEIDAYAQRAHREFYVRSSYFVDQIIQGFKRKDFRLVKALIKLAFQKDVTKPYWGE